MLELESKIAFKIIVEKVKKDANGMELLHAFPFCHFDEQKQLIQ